MTGSVSTKRSTLNEGLTENVLLSAVDDFSLLCASVERVRVHLFTLMREHGVQPPKL